MPEQGISTDMPKSDAVAAPTWAELFRGRNAIFSLALGGSVALHALNIYIAITIMPSVVADIGGLDYYAWSTTVFVVASILGSALSARLLQRVGARGAYGVAALLFGAGTILCALAPNMPVLLAGRFVQGFGGGFLYALAYGVIRLVFPDHLWARAIGLISAMWGIATLTGPAIGGVFAELGAWRAAFWSLIPFILVFAILAYATLPGNADSDAVPSRLPLAQLVLLTATVIALSAGSLGDTLYWNLIGIGVTLVLAGLLTAVELRSGTRLLPRGALKVTGPLGALYAVIALLVIGMQPEIFVPYLLQVLHGQSPLIAGYLAALMAIGWTLASLFSANLSSRSAPGAITISPVLGLIGLIVLALFMPVVGSGSWIGLAPVCASLGLVGASIGLAWPHVVTMVFQRASPDEQAIAAGAITTVQLFATALGAATAGMVANLSGITQPGGVAGASNAALWLFGLFALAPALCIPAARRAARPGMTPR